MKKILIFLLFFFQGTVCLACTTFLMEREGHFYFGKNYDWVTGNGILVVNAKGLQKHSAADEGLTWTSRYGSVSFNQFGKEFPNGGMNEKGLVVELMWLDGSEYPVKDGRPEIGVLQWIQYQLDNASTIEEVIASDIKIRISPEANTPLHYLVADASGHAASIEFLEGKMVVHKGKNLPFPVLANTDYETSLKQTRNATGSGNSSSIADNSLQRFAQACMMLQKFKTSGGADPLDDSFSILNKVSQGDFTKWSIVYDITAGKIHFLSNGNSRRTSVDLKQMNFDCSSVPGFLSLHQTGAGDLSKKMEKLSSETNQKVLERSVKESESRIRIPQASVEKAILIFNQFSCNSTKK